MNQTAKDFLETVTKAFVIRDKSVTYSDWLSSNTTLGSKPFVPFPFQIGILNDTAPNQAVIKVSQVGLTECLIRKCLAFAKRNQDTKVIYTLPNDKLFKEVSQTRLAPVLEANSVFRNDGKIVRNVNTYQIDTSFVMMVKADESGATSTPGDFVLHDEEDLSDAQVIALFQSRLQRSAFKWRHRFSTPTFPQYGVDAAYELSDQREYIIRCHRCNTVQVPDFTRDFVIIPGLPDSIQCLSDIDSSFLKVIDLENSYVGCHKCHAHLDLGDPTREWVVTNSSLSDYTHGYRVRPFTSDNITVKYLVSQLIEYKRTNNIRGWWNTAIGKPYTNGNIQLTYDTVLACCTSTPQHHEPDNHKGYFVGIDMGIICHVVVKCDNNYVMFKTVHSEQIVDFVKTLCSKYNVVAGACDRHPYTPTANAIYEASGWKIFPTEYRGSKSLQLVKEFGDKITHVQADRTTLLDEITSKLRKRNVVISGWDNPLKREEIINHCKNIVRDETPGKPATYIKLSNEDHYIHAMGFCEFSEKLSTVLNGSATVEPRICVAVASAQCALPRGVWG